MESSCACQYKYIFLSKVKLFSMKNHLLSPTQIAALRKRFERCKTQILALDWVTQGSLSQSPQGTWRWTRKAKAKTVTVALSDQQAELFRRAIEDHRKLEKLIDQMRAISQPVLLNSVEGPARRKRRISSQMALIFAPFGSVPTLWRELKKLKLSCQKPERRALEQDPKARARWIATEWPRIKRLASKQRALLFFEDESVVRLTPTVGRTWAPVGKTPIVRVTGKRASVLVMSALSLQGRLFFKIPSEKVNATVFIDFLKDLLAEYPKRKIFVIADQASSHIAKRVKAFVAGQKRLELFYLPTYSPDFNPDEGVWSHLKSQELKAHQATNKEELIKKTHEALKRMAKSPALIRSFFKRCNIT